MPPPFYLLQGFREGYGDSPTDSIEELHENPTRNPYSSGHPDGWDWDWDYRGHRDVNTKELLDPLDVKEGRKMQRPENCPDVLYDMMSECWEAQPNARPTFLDICK